MNQQKVEAQQEVLLSDKPGLPYVFHHHLNKWLKQFVLPDVRVLSKVL